MKEEKEQRLNFLEKRISLMEKYYLQHFNNKLTLLYCLAETNSKNEKNDKWYNYFNRGSDWLKRNYTPIKKDIENGLIPKINVKDFLSKNSPKSVFNDKDEDCFDFYALNSTVEILWSPYGDYKLDLIYDSVKYNNLRGIDNSSKFSWLNMIVDDLKLVNVGRTNYKTRLRDYQSEFIDLANGVSQYQDKISEFEDKIQLTYIYPIKD